MNGSRAGWRLALAALLMASSWASPGGAAAALPAAPVTDLVVDAIEVTQSIQDLNNSVPLVEGKRTFVRIYAHSTGGVYPTTAELRLQSGLLQQTLLPIAPGGPLINVRPTYNRLVPSHAFLFELPLWATFVDVLTLTAEINPDRPWHPRNPSETTYANNTTFESVSFDAVPKLTLVIASQPYTFNNTVYTPTPFDQWMAADWIARAYPVSQVKVYFRTLPTVAASRKQTWAGWKLTKPDCTSLQFYMAAHRAALIGPFYPPGTTVFAALVDDGAGTMRGCAFRGGVFTQTGYARTAAGPSGTDDWGWDFDGSYADWYTGHEVSHALGQTHVRGGPGVVTDGCGGEAKAVANYRNGAISPTYNFWDPAAIFGFDHLHLAQGLNPILSPMWKDLMTYCDYQWISKPTYLFLKNSLTVSGSPLAAQRPAAPQAQDLLAVFGALDPLTGAVSLLPVTVLPDAPEFVPPAPGDYAVVLHDADGNELARYPFAASGLEPGPDPNDEAGEVEATAISAVVPAAPDAAQLQIEGPHGTVLAQVSAGLTVPAVQVTAPNGGEAFTGPVTVTWTADDADGDPLTFNVDYSADNGVSWEPVALYITATQVTVDPHNLPAGDSALMRVTATDGLHAGQDTSNAVFAVVNHLPLGQIVLPAADATLALSQTVALEAQAYDMDLGRLDDAALEWVSDLDGSLGTGAQLSTASLSAGLHTITLVADDGTGQYPLDQVMVTVVNTPNDLPAPPNALTAGPDLVFLNPAAGQITGTLYLDNLNLGTALAWQVTADQAWVTLSATSGNAPQDLVVGTSLTPLDFGTHKSLLTFTSPTDAFDPVYVVVVVENGRFSTWLPAAMGN